MQRPCRFSCLLMLAAGCSDGVDTSSISNDGGALDAPAAADSGLVADAPAADQPPSPDTGTIALDAPPVAAADASGVDALSPPDVTLPDVARPDAATPDRHPFHGDVTVVGSEDNSRPSRISGESAVDRVRKI